MAEAEKYFLACCQAGLLDKAKDYLVKNKGTVDNKSATRGLFGLQIAAGIGNIELVELLLASGASPAIADNMGLTALHIAAGKPNLECLKAMLANPGVKAQVDAQDEDGNTPLHYAAHEGIAENVTALLAAGAAKDVADNNGKTPAQDATERGFAELATAIEAGAPAEPAAEGTGEEADADGGEGEGEGEGGE